MIRIAYETSEDPDEPVQMSSLRSAFAVDMYRIGMYMKAYARIKDLNIFTIKVVPLPEGYSRQIKG